MKDPSGFVRSHFAVSGLYRCAIVAGEPTITQLSGKTPLTTEFAPITQLFPIWLPPSITEFANIMHLFPMRTGLTISLLLIGGGN